MNILSFDTSAAACSVAMTVDGKTLAFLSEEMIRGQSERLIPLIQQILSQVSLKPADLDMIATTVGPGAFTGIRIGLSAARALGLALDIPVVPTTTTRAIAMAQLNEKKRPILVAIETKRVDMYVDILTPDGLSKTGPQALSLKDAATLVEGSSFLLCGDGACRLAPILNETGLDYLIENQSILPDPVVIAKLAAADYANLGPDAFIVPPQPLYIRPPDASLPKANPRAALK